MIPCAKAHEHRERQLIYNDMSGVGDLSLLTHMEEEEAEDEEREEGIDALFAGGKR